MPKKPPRDNPKYRASRTVQSAATVLRRISQKSDVLAPPPPGPAAGRPAAPSHNDVILAGLPEELRPHLVTSLLRPGEIVLFAASATWATRLRVAAAEAAEAGAFTGLAGLAGGPTPRITVRVSPRIERR